MRARVVLVFVSAVAVAIAHAEEPHGIRAKYATPAELSTTNLAPGELVLNTSEPSDLRVGDGGTPGGQSVGAWVMDALREDPDFLHDIGGATADETKALLALSVGDPRPELRREIAASAATSAGNIYSNAAALAAITNALGQRISEFEVVRIGFYPQDASGFNFAVPSDFPTRTLEIFVNPYNLTNTNVLYRMIFATNPPIGPKCVRVVFGTDVQATGVQISMGIANSRKRYFPRDGSIFEWRWMPEVEAWHVESYSGRNDSTAYNAGGTAVTLNLQLPESVPEWIEWRKQQPW